MGIRERHERERQAMRRNILDAARALFVSEGFSNVSVRKIADRIEYSPSAIYVYFAGKDEIFLELAEEGFRLLEEATEASLTSDPVADLRGSTLRYFEFSRAHPEYFSLIFLESPLPIIQNRERFAFLRGLKEQGPLLVQRCVDSGAFPDSTDVEVAARVLWAAVHGPAVIGLTWQTPMANDAEALCASVVDAVIAGLAVGVDMMALESSDAGVTVKEKRT